jgi:molybdopterin molybdotransferase
MIRDSLGVQLPSFLRRCGAEVVSVEFLPDEPGVIAAAFAAALEHADFVISTGGTADGPKDFAKFVIEHFEMKCLVDRVRVRPGYHFLLAKAHLGSRKIPYIALPGNPQSAIAALSSFGVPLLAVMSGLTAQTPQEIQLAAEISTPKDFARLVLGTVTAGTFTAGDYLGSAMLRGLADSAGFALVAPGTNPAGSAAHWIGLPFH